MSGLPSPSLLLRLQGHNLLPLELNICTLNAVSLHNTSSPLIPEAAEDAHSDWRQVEPVNETSHTKTVWLNLLLQEGSIQCLSRFLL